MEELYEEKLGAFYAHRRAQASAYVFYQSAMTSLPQLCQALILLYGGHMVLAGKTAPGTLVSFLLYQQTLSSCACASSDEAHAWLRLAPAARTDCRSPV